MTYRTLPERKWYNLDYRDGGMGDMIANIPTIQYILKEHPHLVLNVFCHDYAVPLLKEVFKNNKHEKDKGTVLIYSLVGAKHKWNDKLLTRGPYLHKISNISSNMVDHAFMTVAHTTVGPEHKNYPQLTPCDVSHFELPEKYIVFATAFTSQVREWKPEYVWEVSEYCREKGYTPVYLGNESVKANDKENLIGNIKTNRSNGIDLINKTSILETHSILAGAQCVLGIDNGLMHLSCLSDVQCIWGFTTVDPLHRLPYRNNDQWYKNKVVAPTRKELACIFCQSRMTFASSEHDFRNCYYDVTNTKIDCVELMTPDRWIKVLQELGI